jgi:hypothetical protein
MDTALTPRPGYWPLSVRVLGRADCALLFPPFADSLTVSRFVQLHRARVLVLSFGSMCAHDPLTAVERVLAVVRAAHTLPEALPVLAFLPEREMRAQGEALSCTLSLNAQLHALRQLSISGGNDDAGDATPQRVPLLLLADECCAHTELFARVGR